MKQALFQPYSLSSQITLKNRIVMAPMTRRCADENHIPTHLMRDYYARRADAGLIVTEGTLISQDALGYGNVPGIYTKEQIQAWRDITTAVHQANGTIFVQLWHCGRVSHPNFHEGRLPISASNTVMNTPLGNSGFTCGKAREASTEEIKSLIADYVTAAKNAMAAGFDGIELHGANGYLIDQFLHHCSNVRTDAYGGTPENMARFCLEVVSAVTDAIGKERVGLRLSPAGHMAEIENTTEDKLVFAYLFEQLSAMHIAYVHMGAFDDAVKYEMLDGLSMTDFARKHYHGNLIASGGYNIHSAADGMNNDLFDLIAFGRPFIANPDLIAKLRQGEEMQSYEMKMLEALY